VIPHAAAVATGLALIGALLASSHVSATEHPADVCLEVAPDALPTEDWDAVAAAVSVAISERPALFPFPHIDRQPTRLDIDSGHLREERSYSGCLEPGAEWTARFGRDFLEAGADYLLAQAPTTPGIDSDVTIEWYPDEARMRTTLVFAGPLDIPNGTCWIDDALAANDETGTVAASGEQGVRTSPFAEGACSRFFDHLPDGGAGEQAVTLLPASVTLADGGVVRFVAQDVNVTEGSVTVSGRVEQSPG